MHHAKPVLRDVLQGPLPCAWQVCAPELELTFGDMIAALVLVARRQREEPH